MSPYRLQTCLELLMRLIVPRLSYLLMTRGIALRGRTSTAVMAVEYKRSGLLNVQTLAIALFSTDITSMLSAVFCQSFELFAKKIGTFQGYFPNLEVLQR